MAKHPTIETDAPLPMIIEMRCRKCRAPLTVALRLLNPVPPRVVKDGEQLLDRGEAALSHTVRTRGNAADSYGMGYGVVVNTADLVKTTCDESSFGCCGHSPATGPNLTCRNGHQVGSLVDECSTPHFAHLSLQHCELLPLAPTA